MTAAIPPPVLWAQRHSDIYLTFCVEDCKKPEITIEANKVYFKGVGGAEKKLYELTIDLYKAVEPEKCEKAVRDRNIEVVLKKANSREGYWPQLTQEKKKYHWLKVDFNKWQDEDGSENEMGGGGGGVFGDDLEEMMRSMGGLGGGGGDQKSALDFNELDSDDEDLPDLVD